MGPTPGGWLKSESCPSNFCTAAYTKGLPSSTHASLTRYRVEKLSQPSTTTSYGARTSSAFAALSRTACVCNFTCGLMPARRCRADSTFGVPTAAVACTTCRCKFDSSTTSSSTTPIVPTPAAARYSSAGAPRPPAPRTTTEEAFRRRWPSTPTSSRIRWREYRRISSCVSGGSDDDGASAVASVMAISGRTALVAPVLLDDGRPSQLHAARSSQLTLRGAPPSRRTGVRCPTCSPSWWPSRPLC